jgi:hypothetical protein
MKIAVKLAEIASSVNAYIKEFAFNRVQAQFDKNRNEYALTLNAAAKWREFADKMAAGAYQKLSEADNANAANLERLNSLR